MKMKSMLFFAVIALALAVQAPGAFAKKEGVPGGWGKGEKKGWDGGAQPPGLSKKDAKKAEKEAKKAEKEARKAAKEAEKAARKKK